MTRIFLLLLISGCTTTSIPVPDCLILGGTVEYVQTKDIIKYKCYLPNKDING